MGSAGALSLTTDTTGSARLLAHPCPLAHPPISVRRPEEPSRRRLRPPPAARRHAPSCALRPPRPLRGACRCDELTAEAVALVEALPAATVLEPFQTRASLFLSQQREAEAEAMLLRALEIVRAPESAPRDCAGSRVCALEIVRPRATPCEPWRSPPVGVVLRPAGSLRRVRGARRRALQGRHLGLPRGSECGCGRCGLSWRGARLSRTCLPPRRNVAQSRAARGYGTSGRARASPPGGTCGAVCPRAALATERAPRRAHALGEMPSLELRLALAKMLMEVGVHAEALEVLQGARVEDDDSMEIRWR